MSVLSSDVGRAFVEAVCSVRAGVSGRRRSGGCGRGCREQVTAGRARYLCLQEPAGTKTCQRLNAGICGSLGQKGTELKVTARLEGGGKSR